MSERLKDEVGEKPKSEKMINYILSSKIRLADLWKA